eukprot:7638596-Pyramimonas_sp.AAC.1
MASTATLPSKQSALRGHACGRPRPAPPPTRPPARNFLQCVLESTSKMTHVSFEMQSVTAQG